MHLETLVNWPTTLSGRHFSLPYSEDQLLNGTSTLRTLLPGRMSKQTSLLYSPRDELNLVQNGSRTLYQRRRRRNSELPNRIKRTVDKESPDDMEKVAPGDHGGARTAQARQRQPRYIDYTMKGLRPRYLQRKAEYPMENPNATWNALSTRIIERDVSFLVSSNFLDDKEQTKAQMATLGRMKNLR